MVTLHNLGFPRIGKQRELKFALESYWKGNSAREQLLRVGEQVRQAGWAAQTDLDRVPVGDFSFYDHVLDMSFLLGNLPERVQGYAGDPLDNYFRVARGRSADAARHESVSEPHPVAHDHTDGQHKPHDTHHGACCHGVSAGEMTKWFDTNYHYIVPEFDENTRFSLDPGRLLDQLDSARASGVSCPKPVIIGPVTYLALGKSKDGYDKLALLDRLLPVYVQLLESLADRGVDWVQIDEPVLVTELDNRWQHALNTAYHQLKSCRVKLLLATYFGQLGENQYLAAHLPVAGLHIDVATSRADLVPLLNLLPTHKVLSLGVISGRNVWKTDLNAVLDWLEPLAKRLGDRLWIAPSCSLLHVPVDLESEACLDHDVQTWLAFAVQKLQELQILGRALVEGREVVQEHLDANRQALESRRVSARVHRPQVQAALGAVAGEKGHRQTGYAQRARLQAEWLNLPRFPTTTIGSFPQTEDIRRVRKAYRTGELDRATYESAIRAEIERVIRAQESLGLDVLVHGEAERNDMVEYFGEHLTGYAFTTHGWVQSYGSRCVKPPILYGDVSRPSPITIEWTRYAQSLTDRPVKGMLTGPVTILNWSFVRDDQPRSETCRQIALAIREEVLDLQAAGVRIIQIDEAALREGLPLRRSQWDTYLQWAIECFRLAANGVDDQTQIHTHMCYSEFNDIIESIAEMDADVITIETSRSDMELLDAFDRFHYPNEIGPGVYDIHSPNVPSTSQIVRLMQSAARRVPAERLWINPDCGLKTRQWPEVEAALRNMVNAARVLRASEDQAATQVPQDDAPPVQVSSAVSCY